MDEPRTFNLEEDKGWKELMDALEGLARTDQMARETRMRMRDREERPPPE